MNSELIIYQTEDGNTKVNLKAIDGTVWLTQKEIAVLFDRDIRTINEHLKTIFADNELIENSVIRKFRITAVDGKSYDTAHYNLDVILNS
jgi:hypothetical protein